MKLVSVAQMLKIEEQAVALGLSYHEMMENAGKGLAQIVEDLKLDHVEREVIGLVGPGNNGGDTLIALSHLAANGWRARAFLVRRESDALVERLERVGGESVIWNMNEGPGSLEIFTQNATIVLDGLLGTGARPPLREDVAVVLAIVNRIQNELDDPPYVIAVDCPSGVDCDTGEAAPECITADLTVTMAAVKQGLLKMPAYDLVGDLQVVDIGLPAGISILESVKTEVAEEYLVASIMPGRPNDSHKGTFGSALITAGSLNYTGAALLAGKAAYRAGAGLVTLAVPFPLHAALAGEFPEATWLLLPYEHGVISIQAAQLFLSALDRASAVLIGPGLGTADTTEKFLTQVLAGELPEGNQSLEKTNRRRKAGHKRPPGRSWPALTVDADGLKILAGIKDWPKLLPPSTVLTPHPGEMATLTGLTTSEIQKDRQAVAARFAREWGHIVVLKGAFTVIASSAGRITIIPMASAALAHAGTGDVLAGLIVGLQAQGVGSFEAAVAGAWIHAQAGMYAARKLGTNRSVLAGDVLDTASDVIRDLAIG